MTDQPKWVTADNAALLTDQYELTMLQAYWREEMDREAVFSLYVRRLPEGRNYLLACGLGDVLDYIETMRFNQKSIDYLAERDEFSDEFLDWLKDFRFSGDVYAVREGTPVFSEEPIIEVAGPIAEAQLLETFVMNQIHFQTVLASKAARVVSAAGDRAVVDFGLRRMHGADAGIKAARAFHIAGVAATSNVLAGQLYGVPVTGTMAHSYIQAHDRELDAFRAFAHLYGDTILLVDTYDTLEGVRKVVELAEEMGDEFRVRGIRLDSGDLAQLAVDSRKILDDAGLENVDIFASGGLNEHNIAEMIEEGAPISGFGVGTGMGVADDAPALDIAYKLTAYAETGRLKLSSGKKILPGRKQIFRIEENGGAVRDVLGRADEDGPGRPLLRKVMSGGKRVADEDHSLDEARERAREEIDKLPERIRSIAAAEPPYPVQISDALKAYQREITEAVKDAQSAEASSAERGSSR
ncbi:MAG: nicotinate phosphoribosyltransferase [Gemmatimonadetes bacterium]|uniref:Nicotinate phosphoribosyltransferase n=1 Tax=Candidatus Kutchimonas denitrificans TaxID=3056748 RepID=A0AAE4ZC25_9BACT|nr:nicotinate phosphoribosyltransferase [Gemmatimonadota bacterium]NIR76702.1 nicotinate phosphoribosyltransferase [Candidatus Kutchimonas denitrificans]NIS01189.1 nicotinate phosphoribosyltransferase [Gemmatimonadota bacterium]NIT68228.1 nicotinate phosphoribosyltransferase [Gemmatimonadota bacterium]NIW75446.1 nicotinate phosphoribosyltransferase [Gemmatimonadota bacterium]